MRLLHNKIVILIWKFHADVRTIKSVPFKKSYPHQVPSMIGEATDSQQKYTSYEDNDLSRDQNIEITQQVAQNSQENFYKPQTNMPDRDINKKRVQKYSNLIENELRKTNRKEKSNKLKKKKTVSNEKLKYVRASNYYDSKQSSIEYEVDDMGNVGVVEIGKAIDKMKTLSGNLTRF